MLRAARLVGVLFLAVVGAACMPPSWAANALLHPPRRPVSAVAAPTFRSVEIAVAPDVKLSGWLFPTARPRRGLVVYLHGVADNRMSGAGIARHFNPLGFDVLAYDSRAHGESGGAACTYGFYEKADVSRVLDAVGGGRVILFGVSLGAAVALQAAPLDDRVALVVAVAPFSDLRTVGRERAPFFASQGNIDEAFRLAEAEAHFRADEVSPVAAAARIKVPVVLLHGAADTDTRPSHSERIYAALAGPKKLILVAGAHHQDVLTPGAWAEIDAWVAGNWRERASD